MTPRERLKPLLNVAPMHGLGIGPDESAALRELDSLLEDAKKALERNLQGQKNRSTMSILADRLTQAGY
jgi:hypothetical protein